MKKCFVATCKNYKRQSSVTFFRMTKERYETWMKAIGRNIDMERVSYERLVCADHFLPEDFTVSEGRLQLKKSAVPVPNLKSNKNPQQDGPPPSSYSILRSEELITDPSHRDGHFRIEHISVVPERHLASLPNAEVIETDTLSTMSTSSTPSESDNDTLDAKHFLSLLRTFHSYCLPPGKTCRRRRPVGYQKKLNDTISPATQSENVESKSNANEDAPRKPIRSIEAFRNYSSSAQKLKLSLETSIRQKGILMKRVNSYKAKIRRLTKKIVFIKDAMTNLEQQECIW